MLAELLPWAQSQAEASGYKTVGIYAGALGFGYSEELLKQKNMPVPKCWADLTYPAYKGEVQIANPNSSGTSYTTLATIVQLLGEAKAFDWLMGLHKKVNQSTNPGPPLTRTPTR